MAGDVTIAVTLEGQLRLDDQPSLHEAVALARRHHGGRLFVLACRPHGQRPRGPHQRRLEAEALASLQTRLAAAAIPLLHFPQLTTAAALAANRSLLRPEAVLPCRESRLFGDWPVEVETFPRVFAQFRRGLSCSPTPALPPPDLSGLGSAQVNWPEAWLRPLDPGRERPSPDRCPPGSEHGQLGLSGRRGLRSAQLRGADASLRSRTAGASQ